MSCLHIVYKEAPRLDPSAGSLLDHKMAKCSHESSVAIGHAFVDAPATSCWKRGGCRNFCSRAGQMQASTRKMRTAYLRNASGGIGGKMLTKPPHLRSPDAPSLSRHDARSNINYHHQISISCYIPSNFNWNLQGVIHRPRGAQAQADEPVRQDTCCRHRLFSRSSSVLARVRARVLARARARARVRGALMWPCACVRSRSGAGAYACACARSRVRAYTRLWRCACVRLASWCILVQGPTAVVCMVSSLDTKMHMQLQTAVCAQGVCTQLHAACTAARLQSPMKFIHACRLGLRPIFAAAVPLF